MAAKFSAAMLVVALAAVGFAGSASAYSGEYAAFNNCPVSTPGVNKCIHSVTVGGKVKLGNKTVPIVNPVTLDGGFSKPTEGPEEEISKFYGGANGTTLAKVGQPVPGGLAGLVNCKEIGSWIVRIACEATFENGLTGVNSILELAKPATDIRISEINLVFEEKVALSMPVKVRLENPFLGSSCYVGSSTSPIPWNLTTGTSGSLKGTAGLLTFTEEAQILHLAGTELVDNTWAAPKATGCGGFGVELILNPILDSMVGLPAAAGVNQAVLKNNSDVSRAVEVVKHP
jgi:hypothetical protein